MKSNTTNPEAYIDSLPADRQAVIQKLREIILTNTLNNIYELLANYQAHRRKVVAFSGSLAGNSAQGSLW